MSERAQASIADGRSVMHPRALLELAQRSFRRSLIARLLILTAPFVLAAVLGLTLILPRVVSQAVFELHRTQLLRQSAMLELTLQHAFMTGDMDLVGKTLENASHEGDVLSLRLLSPKSTIFASSLPDEAGVTLRMTDEVCVPCHNSRLTPAPAVVRTLPHEGGPSTLITAQPLENQAACQRCHASSDSVLGVLLMESTTTGLDLSVERLSWGLAVAGTVALGVIVYHLLSRMIHTPAET